MKTNVAFFYGCRSVEHEVSIITAIQAIENMDKEKYDIIPIYIIFLESALVVLSFYNMHYLLGVQFLFCVGCQCA